MFLFPETGIVANGPYSIGVDTVNYRNPMIAMSQKTDAIGSGIGNFDIRTIVFYEHKDGGIYGSVTDAIIETAPNFQYLFVVASSLIKGVQLHAIYDPYNENFLMTYYDKINKKLPFCTKSLTSPGAFAPIVLQANYRDASTPSTVAVKPRVDINQFAGRVEFAWNDSGASMFESDGIYVSIDENNIESVSNLLLFPNPTTDYVNIAFNSISKQTIKLAIYDLNGRVVYFKESDVMQGENLLNVYTKDLAQGQYVLIVSSFNNNYPIKLIISR